MWASLLSTVRTAARSRESPDPRPTRTRHPDALAPVQDRPGRSCVLTVEPRRCFVSCYDDRRHEHASKEAIMPADWTQMTGYLNRLNLPGRVTGRAAG